MGRKTFAQAIQALSLATVFFAASQAHAELQLTERIQEATTSLTTDQVLDEDIRTHNPHRVRYVVHRELKLAPIQAVPLSKDASHAKEQSYGVAVGSLENSVSLLLRPLGSSLYRSMEFFPCTDQPDARFATEDETRAEAAKWVQVWQKKVKGAVFSLESGLMKIREPSEALAVAKAQLVLENWEKTLRAEFDAEVQNDARKSEWKIYKQRAASMGLCKSGIAKESLPAWKDMMEPPSEIVATAPLVRSPARRASHGDWVLRVNASAAGIKINGQFLIDLSSSSSLLSPGWLESQGLDSDLLETFGKSIRSVKRRGKVSLTKNLILARPETSGFPLGITEFGSQTVDVFSPPADFDSCCDGVLGADFFSINVVQFDSSAPLGAVLIWARKNYRPPTGYRWEELALNADGTFPDWVVQKIRGTDSVVLDLPHGRIWYPPVTELTDKKQIPPLGLKLEFVMKGLDRFLKIKKS